LATATEAQTHNLYEGMFLVDTNKFANDPKNITDSILGTLEKVGAEVVTHRPWQDGKLAYQIGRYRKGLHYLVYFKMPPSAGEALTRACRLNDLIIRQLIITHPETLFNAMVSALTPDDAEAPEEAPAEAPAATPEQAKAPAEATEKKG
jgi:small subunit ribosomal protein S6